jgi:hypothetical protein
MPNQVDGALVHAMSGNERSRVRTEFRLRPPEPINQCLLESRGPTLLCNHVDYFRVRRHLARILRWDLVSISPRALEILDPNALPYSRPAVSHIGLTKWD